MKDLRLNKLFFTGKSNFNGNLILKIASSLDDPNEKALCVLVISKETENSITKEDMSKYSIIILLNGVTSNLIANTTVKIIQLEENIELRSGDVIEISSTNKLARIQIVFKIGSVDNTLIITNACNNKCIMCPEPIIRPPEVIFSLERTEKILILMDKTVKNLCISGGEPTLIKRDLVKVLSLCRRYLPNTQLSLITNGRMFFYRSFVSEIRSVSNKSLLFCIPIHSHDPAIHDQITQVKDSFYETVTGIKNLLEESQLVELRIVIQKNNYKELIKISNYILENFPKVNRVAFIGMEMSGLARKNINDIWINYSEIMPFLNKAVFKLLSSGISTKIFNIPLCKTDPILRETSVQSISDYKIRYLPECEKCQKKNECGGSFWSTVDLLKKEGVMPISNDA